MSSFFYPKSSLIASITQGVQTTITFTENCDFTPGQVVSFRVYKENGMTELNNVQTNVVSNTANSILVNIDSRNFTPFIYSTENEGRGPAMTVPAGSGIVPNAYPAQTNLADAFDNVPTT